ncbi:MAG TPA: hypothetical protein VL588_10655, partial [Bdellovibrionota bacterium]|nr:hypothetical protein [Bdellovibrionota bacterium]
MRHQPFDWRTYQEFLTVGGRAGHAGENRAPALFVIRDGVVVSAYSSGEDLEEWQGGASQEVRRHFAHREHRLLDQAELGTWLKEALAPDHVVDQAEALRERLAGASGAVAKGRPVAYTHFLLEGLQGWWRRLLPGSFGIYLRLERPKGSEAPSRELCLVVRGGRLECFHAPDLSGLAKVDTRGDEDLIRFLSEKYLVPFQGAVVQEKDWEDWSRLAD